jgi:hypothetical protein
MRRFLYKAVKTCGGNIRILSLRRLDTVPIPEADFSLEAALKAWQL